MEDGDELRVTGVKLNAEGTELIDGDSYYIFCKEEGKLTIEKVEG